MFDKCPFNGSEYRRQTYTLNMYLPILLQMEKIREFCH